ncbi:Isoaspartyl dipeptidase [Chlorella vulgaris]
MYIAKRCPWQGWETPCRAFGTPGWLVRHKDGSTASHAHSCGGIVSCSSEPPPDDQTTILVAGGQILAFLTPAAAEAVTAALPVAVRLDAAGLLAVPGFVDLHVHVCGGGGEAGPASRTPEAALSELLAGGLTTVVGVTGTDSVSRSQPNLIAKIRGLNNDGITAFHWCGSYSLPPDTVTGGVQRELSLIDSCIGVGEVAVSDHRGSAPTPQDLLRLALDARVGGMLGAKAGLVHCHLGAGSAGLQPLRKALELGAGVLPITSFHPTHLERSPQLTEQGAGSAEQCLAALELYRQRGLPLDGVTVSSDSCGSLPVFDAAGRLVKYDRGDPGAILSFLQAMVLTHGWSLPAVLPLVTCNPANRLGLRKGRLAPRTLELRYVLARGVVVKTPEWVRGGMFEKGPSIRPHNPAMPS